MHFIRALNGVILCVYLYIKRFVHRHVVKPRGADSSLDADVTCLAMEQESVGPWSLATGR